MSTDLVSKNNTTTDITDVVWLQTSFIGDIVITTAAFAALHKCLPNVKQHLITTPIGKAALEGHPLLASIHVFDKRQGGLGAMFRLRREIKSLKLNSAIILQPHKSLRSTLLSQIIGLPFITYTETNASWLATKRVPRVSVMHEADRIALLLEGLGLDRKEFLGSKPNLPQTNLPISASALGQKRQWIGIAPGSVWATKRWPTPKFATLTQLLLDRPDTGVVLLGSKDEIPAAQFIEDAAIRTRPGARDRVINLVGKTTLADLNGIYPRLSIVITNDSSPIHYASACNIPTVAIFGATVPAMGFGPLATGSKIAEIDLPCRPCGAHGGATCPLGHFKCMNDLSVEAVLDQIAKAGSSLPK